MAFSTRWRSIFCSWPLFAYNQPVHDHFDSMFFLLIQVDFVAQVKNFAIDTHTHIAGTAHLLKDILVLTFTSLDERGK